jgi:glucose/mannose-6-phosphate isomerase
MSESFNLDSPDIYPHLDPQGMLGHLYHFPQSCQKAWHMARGFRLPVDYSGVDKIVILGMGGSAIGGDLASSLAAAECPVPVLVCRDYNLARYVNQQTLVIASSYSGMTEETLSAFWEALNIHAKLLVISTGGKLTEIASKAGVPIFRYDYQSQPRAALPFSFITLVAILQNLGFLPDKSADFQEAVSVMYHLSETINEGEAASHNPAKQLALDLEGFLPVIYGGGILSEVARRWKTQINENAKTTAFHETFSELNHNSIVGYTRPAEITSRMRVIFLSSDLFHERLALRYRVTQTLLEQAGIPYRVVDARGRTALSQMLSLVLLGDYVSYYLAILNGVDPTPVEAIAYLKNALAKS